MRKMKLALGAMIFSSAVLAGAVHAAIIEYNDRGMWLMAIGGATGGEDFNGFMVDTSFDGSSVGLADGMTIGTYGAADSPGINSIDAPPVSPKNIDGTAYAWVAHARFFSSIVESYISFSDPVMAFGADFNDLQDFLVTNVEIYSGDSLLDTLTPASADEGAIRFWGFAADAGEAITEIRFVGGTISIDDFGMDNIEIRSASPIPVPGTLALMGLGLAFAGLAVGRGTDRK